MDGWSIFVGSIIGFGIGTILQGWSYSETFLLFYGFLLVNVGVGFIILDKHD